MGELTRVIEEHWVRTWSWLGTASGGEVFHTQEYLVVRAGLNQMPYNHVLHCAPSSDRNRVIDEIEHILDGRDAAWSILPSCDAQLPRTIERRGWAPYTVCTAMSLDMSEAPDVTGLPADTRIEEVTPATLEQYTELVLDQWHLSPEDRGRLLETHRQIGFDSVRRYLAFVNDQPVAKVSAAMYDDAHVGIYGVGTRPEARGRGLASALTCTALRNAHASGARTAVLHSTPMAVAMYEHIGFERQFEFAVHVRMRASVPSERTLRT